MALTDAEKAELKLFLKSKRGPKASPPMGGMRAGA